MGCGATVNAEPISDEARAFSEALGIDLAANLCSNKLASTRQPVSKIAQVAQRQTPQTVKPVTPTSTPVTQAPVTSPATMPMMDHSHIPVAVPKGAPAPQLSASLTRDVMSGYNLNLRIANYDMTPPPIGVAMENLMAPVRNAETGFVQGHAHLYINGEKIQRVYGNNVHIPASRLKTGMNQMNITINNHAHMFWTYDDKKIITSIFVNTQSPNLVMHKFDSFPVQSD